MIVHGTLHGYILTDIFSLAVRQKASGKLDLFTEGKVERFFSEEG